MKFIKHFVLLTLAAFFLSGAVSAQDTGGLKGRVRTTKGDGIASATIIARQQGEDIKSATADADGNFILENLKPGIYNLFFSRDGYSSGILYNVEVRKKKIGDLGGKLVLRIDQGTQVIIKGTVFDQTGRSVAGVKVEVEKILSDGSTKKVGSALTSSGGDPGVRGGDGNARGDFTFRFSEGTAKYRLTASTKNSSSSKEIQVDNAAIYRLAITLEMKNEN